MNNELLITYIFYHIRKESLLNKKWITNMLTYIVSEKYEDDYIRKDGSNIYLKMDEEVLFTDKYKEPITTLGFKLTIDNNILGNVNGKIDTDLGILFMNYIINTYCFNNKIEFINNEFTLGLIETDYIEGNLVNMDSPDKDTKLNVMEYIDFLDMRLFIESLASLTSRGVSEYNIVKAPGTEEYKTKVIKELKAKYGPDAMTNMKAVKELEDKLIAFDKEYISKDPSYGKFIGKKITNMARKRMYLVFGVGNDLSGEAIPVIDSLGDGWSKDPKVLHAYYNDVRGGSQSRGDETKLMGVLTKFLIRATADILIKKTDCKSKKYILETVTKDDIGRTINSNGSEVLLTDDNIDKFLDKDILFRDVMYCELDDVCSVCTGKKLENYPKSIPLMATELGGTFLKESLKKFHGTELKITTITLDDII